MSTFFKKGDPVYTPHGEGTVAHAYEVNGHRLIDVAEHEGVRAGDVWVYYSYELRLVQENTAPWRQNESRILDRISEGK